MATSRTSTATGTRVLRRFSWTLVLVVLAGGRTLAATPPSLINYQGVLRDNTDKPLSGTYDIVFRFTDAAVAGNEIMIDQHAVATANAITVSGGLFNVPLGSGTITDGSGAGTYTSLDAVFRDYGGVWLEVKVGAETLSPRTQIQSAPYALNAAQLNGQPAASFLDTSSTQQAKSGKLTVTNATASDVGLVCEDLSDGGTGLSGSGDRYGVVGAASGVYQTDGRGGSFSANGYQSVGVWASGATGGEFHGLLQGPAAYLVKGLGLYNAGVYTEGTNIGGEFHADQVGVGAYGGTGIYAQGTTYGVQGTGGTAGGYFTTGGGGGGASLAAGDLGIRASGPSSGAYLFNGAPFYSYAYVPYYDIGMAAWGSFYGGYFANFTSGAFAYVGTGSNKIQGNGSVSFVQNHPADPARVIVYAAPEGDEVAVYTRGSARLVNGEARVALGETFALVANPDIGLTATVTPTGEWTPLTVVEKGTHDLVVRGPAGSGAAFDYAVWGLRIGFEEQSIVQPKQRESKIPAMTQHEKFFTAEPALRSYTALARFKGIDADVSGKKSFDFSRADELRNAVGVFEYKGRPDSAAVPGDPSQPDAVTGDRSRIEASDARESSSSPMAQLPRAAEAGPAIPAFPPNTIAVPVAEAVEAGEVVTNDPAHPGALRASVTEADPGVVGIVAGEAGARFRGNAPIALAGSIVFCKVDAAFGATLPNDLLVASPSRGFAMRAGDNPKQGTVVGKALEALESGTGTIRVLVMSR